MGVIEFLCDIRFHQTYTLPPNSATGRTQPFRISYADYGDQNSDAVVLFRGAWGTKRFCYSHIDMLAKKHEVQIIYPDRPGIGDTDAVGLRDRISMWLGQHCEKVQSQCSPHTHMRAEMVPKLLEHVRARYITIASHSGGIVYALNTMLTYPQLLHHRSRTCAFLHPGSTSLTRG